MKRETLERLLFGIGRTLLCALLLWGCGSDAEPEPTPPVASDVALLDAPDTPGLTDDGAPPRRPDDVPVEPDAAEPPPPMDVEAAARGFRLYYRERVERALVAYNRYMLFGDVGFATTIGKAGISRVGDEIEVVAGDWCGGSDLDRSGAIDADDLAFMTAAQGCHYDPK